MNDLPSTKAALLNTAAVAEFNDEIGDDVNESFELEIHLITNVFNKINQKVRRSFFCLICPLGEWKMH